MSERMHGSDGCATLCDHFHRSENSRESANYLRYGPGSVGNGGDRGGFFQRARCELDDQQPTAAPHYFEPDWVGTASASVLFWLLGQ